MLLRCWAVVAAELWFAAPTVFAQGTPTPSEHQDAQESSPNVGLFRLPAHRAETEALAGPEGFGVLSKDNDFGLMIHWILQTDIHGEAGDTLNDAERLSFLVRFAGLALTARLHRRVRSELLVSFSQNQVNLSEAWLDGEVAPWLHFKAGKFHYPISLERITTSIFFPLADASMTSVLLPSVGTGFQAWGRFSEGTFEYNLGVTSVVSPGNSGDVDVDFAKDTVARVFARPLRGTHRLAIQDLGIGFGASFGEHHGTPTTPLLPRIQSWAGRSWLSFKSDGTAMGTIVADGWSYRLVPQVSWNARMMSLYAEYAQTVDHAAGQSITAQGWSAVATIVLTGEDAVPLHYVVPRNNLDPSQGHWGAFEIAASAGALYVDAPSSLLSPVAALRSAWSIAGGLNWYPSMAVRVMLDVEYSNLEPMPDLATAPNEGFLVGRFQLVL